MAHARARCCFCYCLRVKFPAFDATAVDVDAGVNVNVVATLSLGSTASAGNVKHFPVTHFVDSAAVAVAASCHSQSHCRWLLCAAP